MSVRPQRNFNGWTVDTYAVHNEALREAEKRFQDERDRRYTEVATEREKALKIKESADLAALSLAREIQAYKDEKANELREQINSERGNYASKTDLSVLKERIDRNEGKGVGMNALWSLILGGVVLLGALVSALVIFRVPH